MSQRCKINLINLTNVLETKLVKVWANRIIGFVAAVEDPK